jgi:beta-exotoxin I transport system ATP-binding protein
MGDPLVTTSALTKFYGHHRGVADLNITVDAGEVFGYLGPNGAGKTTTIRLLLDYLRPTRGAATLFGLDSHRDNVAIRRRLGYLPGELRLYDTLSGRELIDYFARLRGGIPSTRVEALAERLDCDLSREIRKLSSGNRQKLGLIQAFMGEPELLILDEPTNGLDPLVQQTFYALVAEARSAGATVFLSSHVLPEVERVCDRVGIIRDGRLAAVERIVDLRTRAMRHLEIEFQDDIPTEAFMGIAGISDLTIHANVLRCTVIGEMNPILKAANRFNVRLLTSSEPSLEEVFLTYYGSETTDAA